MTSRLPQFRDPLNPPNPRNPRHPHLPLRLLANLRSTYRGGPGIDQPLPLSIGKMRMGLSCWMSMTTSLQHPNYPVWISPQRRPTQLLLASPQVDLQNRSQSHLQESLDLQYFQRSLLTTNLYWRRGHGVQRPPSQVNLQYRPQDHRQESLLYQFRPAMI